MAPGSGSRARTRGIVSRYLLKARQRKWGRTAPWSTTRREIWFYWCWESAATTASLKCTHCGIRRSEMNALGSLLCAVVDLEFAHLSCRYIETSERHQQQ